VDNSELDLIDERILEEIAENGRISVTELSNKVGISKTPCGVRLKRLIEDKYVLGFRAILNAEKLDINHVAFVEIKLRDTTESALKAFNEAVGSIKEIEQCHMIAGSFDYLLKVRTKNITAYRRILGEKITTLPNVANSSTYVAMEAVKDIVY